MDTLELTFRNLVVLIGGAGFVVGLVLVGQGLFDWWREQRPH